MFTAGPVLTEFVVYLCFGVQLAGIARFGLWLLDVPRKPPFSPSLDMTFMDWLSWGIGISCYALISEGSIAMAEWEFLRAEFGGELDFAMALYLFNFCLGCYWILGFVPLMHLLSKPATSQRKNV